MLLMRYSVVLILSK